jgi:hypothetical protein
MGRPKHKRPSQGRATRIADRQVRAEHATTAIRADHSITTITTPPEPSERRKAGHIRIRTALEHIDEAAQGLLDACAHLSSVVGVTAEYGKLREMERQLKAFRYELRVKDVPDLHPAIYRSGWGELDRDPQPLDLMNAHHQCCGKGNWRPRS